jgi:hypothetical protein
MKLRLYANIIQENCCYTEVAENKGFLPTSHQLTHQQFKKIAKNQNENKILLFLSNLNTSQPPPYSPPKPPAEAVSLPVGHMGWRTTTPATHGVAGEPPQNCTGHPLARGHP